MAAFRALNRPPDALGNRPNVPLAQFDYWRIRIPWARRRMPSFPPCLIRRVDGIFRPEAAGPGRNFQDVPREPAGKLRMGHARRHVGREGRGGKFDWPMSSFLKPTDRPRN